MDKIQWTPKQISAARRFGKRMAKIIPPPKPITSKMKNVTINGRKLQIG